jgi:hypothetical protein
VSDIFCEFSSENPHTARNSTETQIIIHCAFLRFRGRGGQKHDLMEVHLNSQHTHTRTHAHARAHRERETETQKYKLTSMSVRIPARGKQIRIELVGENDEYSVFTARKSQPTKGRDSAGKGKEKQRSGIRKSSRPGWIGSPLRAGGVWRGQGRRG